MFKLQVKPKLNQAAELRRNRPTEEVQTDGGPRLVWSTQIKSDEEHREASELKTVRTETRAGSNMRPAGGRTEGTANQLVASSVVLMEEREEQPCRHDNQP